MMGVSYEHCYYCARQQEGTGGTVLHGLRRDSRLSTRQFLQGTQGGIEQIGARIALGEIDLMLFFADPGTGSFGKDITYLSELCIRSNVPFAINSATAEALVLALARGDLDWREAIKGNRVMSTRTRSLLGLNAEEA